MAITDFHLLLLDDDPRRRESMLQAAHQAGVERVRAFKDALEARSYFDRVSEGEPPDGRRPSLLLLNLDAPSGMEILSWLRSRPKVRRVIAVGLFDRNDGHVVGPAYDLHVNSCVVRPDALNDQVEFFRSLRKYWEGLNQAPAV